LRNAGGAGETKLTGEFPQLGEHHAGQAARLRGAVPLASAF